MEPSTFDLREAAELVVRTSIVLGVAAISVWLIGRRGSAALRHNVWACGMYLALVLPLLTYALPAWRVLPARADGPIPDGVPPSEVVTDFPAGVEYSSLTGIPRPGTVPHPLQASGAGPGGGPAEVVPMDSGLAGPAAPFTAATLLVRSAPIPWWATLWGIGAAVTAGRLITSRVALAQLARRSTVVDSGPLPAAADRARAALGMRAGVRILTSPDRAMPMSWGIWSGVVLLPDGASRWDGDRLRSVMLHELAHLQRRDPLHQMVAQLTCAVYWFNPLAWIAARRMRVEREQACDDRVLAAGVLGSSYARHLLEVVTGSHLVRPAARSAIAMAESVSQLERRVAAVIDPEKNRRPVAGPVFLAMLATGLVATVSVATARPGQARSDDVGGVGGDALEDTNATAPADPTPTSAADSGSGLGSDGAPGLGSPGSSPATSLTAPVIQTVPQESRDIAEVSAEREKSVSASHLGRLFASSSLPAQVAPDPDVVLAWERLVDNRRHALALAGKQFENGTASHGELSRAQIALSEAQIGLARARGEVREEILAIEQHLDLARQALSVMRQQHQAGAIDGASVAEFEAEVLKVEILLAETRARQPGPAAASQGAPGSPPDKGGTPDAVTVNPGEASPTRDRQPAASRTYEIPKGRSAIAIMELINKLAAKTRSDLSLVQISDGKRLVLEADSEFLDLVGTVIEWGGPAPRTTEPNARSFESSDSRR